MIKKNNIFKELIDEQIENLTNFIIENYNCIDIYFYIGSGIIKYILNDLNKNIKIHNDRKLSDYYLSWNEMINKNFNNNVNITNINDLLNIDFSYSEHIELLNKKINNKNFNKIKNDKNLEFRILFDNLKKICCETAKTNNKIQILTTNHCNTIEHYFNVSNKYNVNQIKEFADDNFSLLKLHVDNKSNKPFYSIDDYIQMYDKKENGKSYIDSLLEIGNYLNNNKKKKLIILFGTSLSELHIVVALNKILMNKEFRLLWIRDINSIIGNNNILCYEKVYESLEKINKKYIEKNYLIIFYDKKNFNFLFKKINNLLINKFIESNKISISDKFFYKFPNYNNVLNLERIKWTIDEYCKYLKNNNYNTKRVLDILLSKSDFDAIWYILLYKSSIEEWEWYLNKIEKLNDTYISFKKLLELISSFYFYDFEYLKNKNNIFSYVKFITNKKILLMIWEKIFQNFDDNNSFLNTIMFLFENIDFKKNNDEQIKKFIELIISNYDFQYNFKIRQNNIKKENNYTNTLKEILNKNYNPWYIKEKTDYLSYYLNINKIEINKYLESKKINNINFSNINIQDNINKNIDIINDLFKKITTYLNNYDINKISKLFVLLEEEIKNKKIDIYLMLIKLINTFYNIINYYLNNKITKNAFLKLSKNIEKIIKNINNTNYYKLNFFKLENEQIKNLNIDQLYRIICLMEDNDFLLNTLLVFYLLNGKPNPSWDFYYWNNSNFTYLQLLNKIFNNNIKIENKFLKLWNDEVLNSYANSYLNVVKKSPKNDFENFLYIIYMKSEKKEINYIIDKFYNTNFFINNFNELIKIFNSYTSNIFIFYFFISTLVSNKNKKNINWKIIFDKIFLTNEFYEICKKYNIYHFFEWISLLYKNKIINKQISKTLLFNHEIIVNHLKLCKSRYSPELSFDLLKNINCKKCRSTYVIKMYYCDSIYKNIKKIKSFNNCPDVVNILKNEIKNTILFYAKFYLIQENDFNITKNYNIIHNISLQISKEYNKNKPNYNSINKFDDIITMLIKECN